ESSLSRVRSYVYFTVPCPSRSTHPSSYLIYTLSLHDALPIYAHGQHPPRSVEHELLEAPDDAFGFRRGPRAPDLERAERSRHRRSEEHTSELQSRVDIVCRLLLEKKKNPDMLDSQKNTIRNTR